MTLEQLIIGLIRIAGSLPVLRWALVGALIAIVVDFSDLFFMAVIDLGGLGDYQAFDKWIDLVYMFGFLWVANRWSGLTRNAISLIVLTTYRHLNVRQNHPNDKSVDGSNQGQIRKSESRSLF